MVFQRILFIQTAFIGDAILTLPALQKLKLTYPEFLIDVLCIPKSREIFEASPVVENVIVLDKKGRQKSLFQTLKFAKELKKNNYLKLYSSHRSFRTSLIVLMLGVKESYGFDNSSFKYTYRNLIKYDKSAHEVQRNLNLIGFNPENENWKIKPEIIFSNDVKAKVRAYINDKKIKKDFIAIAPGSVWETKRYPEKYFIGIIKDLNKKKYQVVLIGSEKDRELCSAITGKDSSLTINTAGDLSVIESIHLLQHAKLLISNDSAPTHMGMAADIKVLTIYCSTIPDFGFYPYNNKSEFISYDDLECKPCGIHGHNKCPIKTFDCGEKLVPQKVITKMEEMLNANQ
jgi:heptosyltransferase-2